jgi:hypothetical protein
MALGRRTVLLGGRVRQVVEVVLSLLVVPLSVEPPDWSELSLEPGIPCGGVPIPFRPPGPWEVDVDEVASPTA